MSNKIYPVDAIKHPSDKRADIPTTEHAGEEQFVIADSPKVAKYKEFKNEFDRGRDPELYWLGKYNNDDEDTQSPDLKVDVRSLYVHEDIQPEMLIKRLFEIKEEKSEEFKAQGSLWEESDLPKTVYEDELEKVTNYYKHEAAWKNRLIQGDSLLVMNSLLKREGMAGKVQCIYIDPPYGIKYGSNWQMKLNNRDVKDNDESVSGEPEMIKAFRDTWELGIHSYLSYLRDRLILARELLSQSGSVFVQISDENVHLVRNLMDEVFGGENFVSQIVYSKTAGFATNTIGNVADYIVWYAKDSECVKVRKLYTEKDYNVDGELYSRIELPDGTRMSIGDWERKTGQKFVYSALPKGYRVFRLSNLSSQGSASTPQPYEYDGKTYFPSKGNHWKANYPVGMDRLKSLKRIAPTPNSLQYVRYYDDFPCMAVSNLWTDTGTGSFLDDKLYVVQTGVKAIQRCILMTTDPGDLVLDPTCGSGTTAYAAEQWGRRWITMDTSRIALNIAKRRIATAIYPYYELFDKSETCDIRQGFIYKTVPHITLKALANDLPFDEETLYDQPQEDKKKIRVAGPFTVETLQSFNVTSPEAIDDSPNEVEENRLFQERIFSHLQTSGIRNGDKSQKAIFHNVEATSNPYLNAKGYYTDSDGKERVAYFHIGPKFGSVCKNAVSLAIREFRSRVMDEGASWLVLLGFSFEDNVENKEVQDTNFGIFNVTKVRMHDDLMQDGLLKKDKGAGSFITIGEPDIEIVKDDDEYCHVEIKGLDIYDPIKDDVKARSVEDISYWEIDDNYNGSQFIVRGIHFCGGDKKEFADWKKGLSSVASSITKKKAEKTLKLVFNDELWDTLYGFRSEPLKYEKGRKVAVRVVSQFGEESSKVLTM